MKVDSNTDLTFTGHWYVDGFNTTSVIEKLECGGWKHICTCDYGYGDPLNHLYINNQMAHKISLLPYIIEKLNNCLTDLSSANLSAHNQMKDAINNTIADLEDILQQYEKEVKY